MRDLAEATSRDTIVPHAKQIAGSKKMHDPDIKLRIDEFKGDLDKLSDHTMVQKHISSGDCYILSSEQYFELKQNISENFNTHSSQIVLVGSAKLGFSIAPSKKYRPFGDESDLDIAIVSEELFDSLWAEAFQFWINRRYWGFQNQFRNYLFRGWLRPDFLPTKETKDQWFEFFRQLTKSEKFGRYKISAGVYKSWWYFESYQQSAVARLRD